MDTVLDNLHELEFAKRESSSPPNTVDRLEVVPTGAALGAEVRGIDFAQPVPDDVKQKLNEFWFEHLVLLFRGQSLSLCGGWTCLKPSIRKRLLSTTTCVLVVFLLLTGWILDRSFQSSVITSAEEQLRLVTDALPVLISYVDTEQRYRFNNKAYEEWFGAPVKFNGDCSAMGIPDSALELPIRGSDASLSAVLDRHIHEVLAKRSDRASFTVRTRTAMARRLDGGDPQDVEVQSISGGRAFLPIDVSAAGSVTVTDGYGNTGSKSRFHAEHGLGEPFFRIVGGKTDDMGTGIHGVRHGALDGLVLDEVGARVLPVELCPILLHQLPHMVTLDQLIEHA